MLYALGLCGIRRTEITQQHLTDARMALNLLFATWGNDSPNLWSVDLVSTTLVPGTATYNVDPDTIMVLDAYIRTNAGTASQNDRIIWPISRTEYASMPNKTLQAPPTVFWFDRLLAPTITLWQTPDDQTTYLLQFYRCISIQDADSANGQTADIPPWWLLAAAFGVGELLAISYAPDRVQNIAPRAEKYLAGALEQNVENTPLFLAPMVAGYYPR